VNDGAPPYHDEAGWFTKTPDGAVHGPYATEAMVRAVRSGELAPSTLVRLDEEGDWRRLVDVPELWGDGPDARPDASPYRRPAPAPSDGRVAFDSPQVGSFGGGFCAGFFGGCIGVVVVHAIATTGTETRRGAKVGFAVGVAIGFLGALAQLVIRTVQH